MIVYRILPTDLISLMEGEKANLMLVTKYFGDRSVSNMLNYHRYFVSNITWAEF